MKQTKIEVIERPEGNEGILWDRDTEWQVVKVDNESVEPFRLTIRTDDDGFPSMVYVEGAHPFYSTWVYHEDGRLLAHSTGLVSGKL